MGIDELKKPPSVWCPHVEIGQGCKIYEDRPHSCRVFQCLWLKDERLPEAMRPDKSKVVLHVQKEEGRLKANVDPDRPDAWQVGLVGAYLRMVKSLGVDILIVVGKKKYLRTAYERENAGPVDVQGA